MHNIVTMSTIHGVKSNQKTLSSALRKIPSGSHSHEIVQTRRCTLCTDIKKSQKIEHATTLLYRIFITFAKGLPNAAPRTDAV